MRILVITDRASATDELAFLLQDHSLEYSQPTEATAKSTLYDALLIDMMDEEKVLQLLKELQVRNPSQSGRTIVLLPAPDRALSGYMRSHGFIHIEDYGELASTVEAIERKTPPLKPWSHNRAFPLLFSLLVALVVSQLWHPETGKATEHARCVACHQDVHREASTARYRHTIAADKDCARCHIIESKNWNAKLVDKAISKEYTREALIPLKNIVERNKKYTLKVVAWDRTSRRSSPKMLELDPARLKPIEGQQPSTLSMSNIRVEEIRPGIFTTATISWTTNEFTRAAVEYGEDKRYLNVTPWEYSYSKEHRVTLKGLKHGRRYYYRIILKDIYGNMIRSSDMVLDTKSVPSPVVQKVSNISRGFPTIEKTELLDIEGQPFLAVKTDRPARITITLKPTTEDKTHGDGFLPPKTAQIDVCIECHNQSISHPVGVSASSPNTVVPKNLPTLEGGIITCVTCHYPHGSNKPFFARMDFERDICIECHKKGPFI